MTVFFISYWVILEPFTIDSVIGLMSYGYLWLYPYPVWKEFVADQGSRAVMFIEVIPFRMVGFFCSVYLLGFSDG